MKRADLSTDPAVTYLCNSNRDWDRYDVGNRRVRVVETSGWAKRQWAARRDTPQKISVPGVGEFPAPSDGYRLDRGTHVLVFDVDHRRLAVVTLASIRDTWENAQAHIADLRARQAAARAQTEARDAETRQRIAALHNRLGVALGEAPKSRVSYNGLSYNVDTRDLEALLDLLDAALARRSLNP